MMTAPICLRGEAGAALASAAPAHLTSHVLLRLRFDCSQRKLLWSLNALKRSIHSTFARFALYGGKGSGRSLLRVSRPLFRERSELSCVPMSTLVLSNALLVFPN